MSVDVETILIAADYLEDVGHMPDVAAWLRIKAELLRPASENDVLRSAVRVSSEGRWIVGQLADHWMTTYARGRTHEWFGAMTGHTADEVYHCQRVWYVFGSLRWRFPNLSWRHFWAVLTWTEDAIKCLTWANENEATVAEMKAWRRAQRGEDLTVPQFE